MLLLVSSCTPSYFMAQKLPTCTAKHYTLLDSFEPNMEKYLGKDFNIFSFWARINPVSFIIPNTAPIGRKSFNEIKIKYNLVDKAKSLKPDQNKRYEKYILCGTFT